MISVTLILECLIRNWY